MSRLFFMLLFILTGSIAPSSAQSWLFEDGNQGVEGQGIHYTDNNEEAIGGSLSYTWNSRIDIRITYLYSDFTFENRALQGQRFIPQIDWYVIKYSKYLPLYFAVFAAYHQESFSQTQPYEDFRLSGNGWAAGFKALTGIYQGQKLILMPILEYRYESMSRTARRTPTDQDFPTFHDHVLNISLKMGREFIYGLSVFMEPGIRLSKNHPGFRMKLGFLLPLESESD
ncbi:MAG: hypothetical protein JXR46_04990 [Calditrichaceae bacterium]|nr:hypothetical protein [Calditrichaceae bacterium]MBN2708384.1 hypothetical protein [Calditrichaceae bacterium]